MGELRAVATRVLNRRAMVAGPLPTPARAPSRLESWSRMHAPLMLAACACSAWFRAPWPAGVVALASFGALLARARSEWADRRRIAPNTVTASRLLIIVAMSAFMHGVEGTIWVSAVIGIFVLDYVDGWLARRANAATAFGAHFDMETDAFVVVVVVLELFTRGQLGVWVLTTGVLRYVYVLMIALLPPPGGEMPRSTLGRNAFGALIIGLSVALAFPDAVGSAGAAIGTSAVTLSFARAFYWSYFRRPGAST